MRGLGREEKRKVVRNAIDQSKPDVIFLQETKLNEGRECALREWMRARRLGMESVPAIVAAGGLAVLFKKDVFSCIDVVRGDTFILLHLRIQQNQEDVMVCNVYGPHERRGRELVFNEIGELLEGFAGRVVVGGDFNTILNDGERRGVGENMRGDDSFKLFVNDNYLIDLPQQNGDYTWGSTRNSGLWSRLDRWLINEDALLGFDGVSQVAKDWGVSDHRAICLNWGTKDFGPKPFTFYNFWLMEAGFKEMVAEWWGTNMISGWSGYVLLQKLKGLRGRIRLWCKERGSWGSTKIVLLKKR